MIRKVTITYKNGETETITNIKVFNIENNIITFELSEKIMRPDCLNPVSGFDIKFYEVKELTVK